jgi:hypothetical protein
VLVQVDTPAMIISSKAILLVVPLRISSVKAISPIGILTIMLANTMKLILTKIKMTQTIKASIISNRITKIMIKINNSTRTKATINSRTTINNLLNLVKLTLDQKKPNRMISPSLRIELLQLFQVTKLVVKWEVT